MGSRPKMPKPPQPVPPISATASSITSAARDSMAKEKKRTGLASTIRSKTIGLFGSGTKLGF